MICISDNLYKVVVVHDGARPLVPEELLVKVILEAATHGAAGATRPLISTVVKPLIDGHLEASLNRNEYLLSETPQAFLFPLIMNAYQKVIKISKTTINFFKTDITLKIFSKSGYEDCY